MKMKVIIIILMCNNVKILMCNEMKIMILILMWK